MKLSSVGVASLLALAATACGSDSATAPVTAVTASLTIDASQSYAYLRLGSPAQVVTVSDPRTSSAWDLGFFATNVVVNGGAVGPGAVSAHCLCQNAALSNADVQAMTPANQLSLFEGVVPASIPGDGAFSTDQLTPAINGWFSGTGAAAVANTSRAWLLRKGTTSVVLGKFRVTALQNASATTAGQIAFEYALQSASGAAFGASQSTTVDVRNGPVYFDLTAGQTSNAVGSWDLRLSGFEIRTNSGVSGSGSVTALVDNRTPYAQIDATYAATAPAAVFKKDAYSGVFVSQPWYRYNITGTDNQIWPTFNVYLVKRGAEVFKVQLTGYYGTNGAGRQITVRYAKLK